MQFNELTHIAGPAIVTFDTQTWYSEADISVDIQQDQWDLTTSRYGRIDRRIKSLPVAVVSFKPDGQVTSGRMTKAFPYGLSDIGKSIFGSADKTLVIQTLAGQKYTFKKAGLSKSPGLFLGVGATAFDGNIEFTCIHATNADVAVADNFLKIEALAYSDITFDETKIITPGFTAAFGLTPYDVIDSLDGFKVALEISVARKTVDRLGVVGAYLTGIGPATCSFTPAGMTEANWLALTDVDGAGIKLPGVSGSAGSTDLVISGTGLSVTMPKSNCVGGKLNYGTDKERLGELMFQNRAVFSAGVPGSLLTIAVS